MKKIGIFLTSFTLFSISAHADLKLDASKSDWEVKLFQNISNGINVNDIWVYDQNSDVIPALHFSLLRGKMKTAKKLVELGADITKKTSSGDSVFNYVCSRVESRSSEVPVFIIDKALNAGLSINDFEGTLPRSVACSLNPHVASYYEEKNVQFNINLYAYGQPVFFDYAKGLKAKDFNKLLYLKPDLSLRDEHGNSVLHTLISEVSSSDSKDLSKKVVNFVELGANVNARNNNTMTPLMDAVIDGDYNYVRTLVEAGAIIGLRNKSSRGKNRSAIDYAKMIIDKTINNKRKNEMTRIWRYLLEQDDLQTL